MRSEGQRMRPPDNEKAAHKAASQETLDGRSDQMVPSTQAGWQCAGSSAEADVIRAASAACGNGDPDGHLGLIPIESSLVRKCDNGRGLDAVSLGGSVCFDPEPSVATRSDGGVLPGFIYAAPRSRPIPPDPSTRKGYSSALPSKGARSIQAAAQIAHRSGNPLRAMWVFSINDDNLPDFIPPDGIDGSGKPPAKTLSGELRRFFRGLNSYCRTHNLPHPEYAWAAESASSGERLYHPHVHCLINLLCSFSDFQDFSTDIEHLWGLGSVHMTKLRKPKNASAYCLKGVSYSVKGSDGNQGRIWGRRYGISRALRHKEIRTPHEDSGSAALAIVEVADRLREYDLPAIRTAYGCFTPRGFYPNQGCTWRQVPLARGVALALIEEVRPNAKMDQAEPF